MRVELIEAARDYRFLLDRGYSWKAALDVISSRYALSRRDRLLLYRCVHTSSYAYSVRRKHYPPKSRRLIVDGFNVLATIYAAMSGEPLYLCDDGVVRDLMGLHARVGLVKKREPILFFLKLLRLVSPLSVLVILDSKISHSGDLAAFLRETVSGDIELEVIVSKSADREIMEKSRDSVVASSDAVVLERVGKIYDLGGEAARYIRPRSIQVLPLLSPL